MTLTDVHFTPEASPEVLGLASILGCYEQNCHSNKSALEEKGMCCVIIIN